jgi:rhamnosyltransferase
MNGASLIGAVVVTYHPDERVVERLRAIRREVDRMVIVDNGSPMERRTLVQEWAEANAVSFVANPENRGLATALNQGMEWCERAGCEWAITFDQDSTPLPGFAAAALATARAAIAPERVAVVGARTSDEGTGREDRWLRPAWYGFRRLPCDREDLVDVTFVITSGALTRVSAWRALGGFDDGLFIDYIDHDFCLRARRRGWRTMVSAHARLQHNLGARRNVVVAGRKMCPTFHSATRHYYIARNRVLMWWRHAWRCPHWWLFDAIFGGLNVVRVLLTEDRRGEKLRAMVCGTWHGLLGRRGALDRGFPDCAGVVRE